MSALRPLSTRVLAAYAAPGLGLALLISPFPAIIAAFYAQYTAASAVGIATVLLAARLLDAAVDPAIGFWSDRTKGPLGSRKPWLLGGAIVGVVGLGVLFQPRTDSGDLYFALGMVLYYVALATIDIPLRAWAGELTSDYQERSRLAGVLTFALLAGGLFYLLLPNVLALPAVGLASSAEFDLDMMATIGRIGMVILPITIMLVVVLAPTAKPLSHVQQTFLDMLRTVSKNRPYWILLAADAATQIAWGVTYAVFIIALQTYFGLGGQVALILVGATLAQILVIPLCTRSAAKIGKHRTWGWASIAVAVLLPVTFLFPGGGQANPWAMGLFVALLSAFGTPNMVFPMAMVSDIADYDTLKSRQNRNGSYYAFRMLCFKGMFALGNALGYYGLALVHYDPKSAVNSATATTSMLVMLVVVPAIFNLVAGLFLLRFPLDARRHAIIRRRIDRRRENS